MTDESIEKALNIALSSIKPFYRKQIICYLDRLKSAKRLAETQLKELLSALYKLTDNVWEAYDLCRDDVLKLAKDYGIKEEELK